MRNVLLGATLLSALFAGSALADPFTFDSEELKINLSGTIASQCILSPDGSLNKTVNMLSSAKQELTTWTYNCNSPYKLTLKSEKGKMANMQSGDTFGYDYDIVLSGYLGAPNGALKASQIQSTPAVIDSKTSWTNLFVDGGVQNAKLDLIFNIANTPYGAGVAGEYKDTLTVTLTGGL